MRVETEPNQTNSTSRLARPHAPISSTIWIDGSMLSMHIADINYHLQSARQNEIL